MFHWLKNFFHWLGDLLHKSSDVLRNEILPAVILLGNNIKGIPGVVPMGAEILSMLLPPNLDATQQTSYQNALLKWLPLVVGATSCLQQGLSDKDKIICLINQLNNIPDSTSKGQKIQDLVAGIATEIFQGNISVTEMEVLVKQMYDSGIGAKTAVATPAEPATEPAPTTDTPMNVPDPVATEQSAPTDINPAP